MKVGPEGGLATVVSNEAEGQRFQFANDLDIASDGCIYFTDTSPRWKRRWVLNLLLSRRALSSLVPFFPFVFFLCTVIELGLSVRSNASRKSFLSSERRTCGMAEANKRVFRHQDVFFVRYPFHVFLLFGSSPFRCEALLTTGSYAGLRMHHFSNHSLLRVQATSSYLCQIRI